MLCMIHSSTSSSSRAPLHCQWKKRHFDNVLKARQEACRSYLPRHSIVVNSRLAITSTGTYDNNQTEEFLHFFQISEKLQSAISSGTLLRRVVVER